MMMFDYAYAHAIVLLRLYAFYGAPMATCRARYYMAQARAERARCYAMRHEVRASVVLAIAAQE